MEVGSVVISNAGRDKNCLMAVVGEKDGFLLVADGKKRKVSKPKLKNIRHISVITGHLSPKELLSDKSIRRALREYAEKEN